MNEQLLRELSHITEEEQDILDGKTGIDRTLYSEGSDFVSGKIDKAGVGAELDQPPLFEHLFAGDHKIRAF